MLARFPDLSYLNCSILCRFYDYSSSYPEGERMDDDNDGDREVEENLIDDTGYELVLPSGAKIGHRSLHRYYR